MSDEYTPDDEDVEETYVAYEEAFSAEKDPRGNYRRWLAAHDRALREQIAREVRADMFRGVRAWAERFFPGDRWDPQDALDLESALLGTVEANPDRSRARGEGDAHRPERCPTCGCELAYPTAVHVVDCGEGSE